MKLAHFRSSLLMLLAFSFISSNVLAAPKGSFNTNITFLGSPRQLSLYVPLNYDSTKPTSLMICLHGLGDNTINFRNVLVSNSGWAFPKYLPNTIFVCPEAATTSSDFTMPAGNEGIINASIQYAKQNYNIDTTDIVLEGFSLGGRAALRYGLDHPKDFKGLLLNTPAVQGVKEARNLSRIGYTFNYANASKIPIYITHGVDDVNYTGPIDTAFERMVQLDGKVMKKEFVGMGHNIPNMQKMMDFKTFFDSLATKPVSAELINYRVPLPVCSKVINPSVLLRNMGINTVKAINVTYDLNGKSQSFKWSGSLASFQHLSLSLPALNTDTGRQIFVLNSLTVNDTVNIPLPRTTDNVDTFYVQDKALKLPVKEGFESPNVPEYWTNHASGDLIGAWYIDNSYPKSGKNALIAFNTILVFDNMGSKEEMLSSTLDLTSEPNPILTFDMAYNYTVYTPPYFLRDTVFADTLKIGISTDCGATWNELYKSGGKDLATFHKPLTNLTNFGDLFLNPADSNWKRMSIDLTKYNSSQNAIVKFSYISALGGSIAIDNVEFTDTKLGIEKSQHSIIQYYPNPASDKVFITAPKHYIMKVGIMDIAGKVIQSITANKSNYIEINTSLLSNGMYILQILTEDGMEAKELMIQR